LVQIIYLIDTRQDLDSSQKKLLMEVVLYLFMSMSIVDWSSHNCLFATYVYV